MAGIAFIDFIQGIDEDITLFINSFHSVASDQFWQFCSNKIAWIPIYVFAVIFLIKHIGWKRSLAFLVAIGLGFLFCDQLANLVKDAVSRLRPNYSYDATKQGLIVLESRGGFFGFFSATWELRAFEGSIRCRLRLGRSRCPKQGFRRQTLFWRCFGWHSHRSDSRPDTFKCNCPDA